MAKYTQSGRAFSLATSLGADALLLESFTGVENISRLFRFRLQLLAEQPVAFQAILGQPATLTLTLPNGARRFVNGIIIDLSQGGWLPGPRGENTFLRYQADLVPSLWLLTQRVRSRIFQQLSVPDILRKVLHDDWKLGVDFRLMGTYQPRNYCTQYQENDFAFVSRLMEAEGLSYRFEHTATSHGLSITDSNSMFPELAAPASIPYDPKSSGWHGILPSPLGGEGLGVRGGPRIYRWSKGQQVRAKKQTLRDWTFQMADKELTHTASAEGSIRLGSVSHDLTQENDMFEKLSLCTYSHHFDGIDPSGAEQPQELSKFHDHQQHLAKVCQERETARTLQVRGRGNAGHFVPGCTFTLDRHFDADDSYLITKVKHRGSLGGDYVRGENVAATYENVFECVHSSLPYRPPCLIRRPRIEGIQTATVEGPKGETIHVDKYGRIKVRFHWDHDGPGNGSTSCWVRVACPWAGATWGAQTLPRVGQEVVVAFEREDPDRPLILGSVYNSEQMPPYTLPEQRSQSGMVSSSGGSEKYHEIRLDDTAGSERLLLHSEKDLIHESEHDHHVSVGGDHTVRVGNDHNVSAGNSISLKVAPSNSGSGGGGESGSGSNWWFQFDKPELLTIHAPTVITYNWIGGFHVTLGVAGDIAPKLDYMVGSPLGPIPMPSVRFDWRRGMEFNVTAYWPCAGHEFYAWHRVACYFGKQSYLMHVGDRNHVTVDQYEAVMKQVDTILDQNNVIGASTCEWDEVQTTAASQRSETGDSETTFESETRESGSVTAAIATRTRTSASVTRDVETSTTTAVSKKVSGATQTSSDGSRTITGEEFST